MNKVTYSAEHLLHQLGELSGQLATGNFNDHDYFGKPLQIIQKALGYHVSVLYKISNVIEDDLILEVITVVNPEHVRPDLVEGAKISLSLSQPPPEFANEVDAFKNNGISALNIPGWGCDMVGAIHLPENLGHGYLLGGDYFGDESDIDDTEIRVCEVMCTLLSSVLLKTQYEKLANYDGLTGLLNSRAIRDEMEKTFQRQKRKHNGLGGIVLADIDHFKKFNDQYGHIQGDAVLQEVGQLFGAAIRKHIDVGGRYGGEEFLLIYEDSDKEQVLNIVERLRHSIETHPFKKIGANGSPLEGEFLHATMSFGIALLNDPAVENSKELISRADKALYQSKANGRNRVTLS